jgi:two-component system, CitB family, sensor kinase
VLVAVLVVGAGVGAAYLQARRSSEHQAAERVLAIAHTVAASPEVVAAVGRPDPTRVLQPVAERVRRDTGTDFVVVMSRSGTRYTHPDPRQIGQQFLGHIAAAQRGGDLVESYRGTLGPSMRAVVPVERGATVVGLVSVGIRRSAVSEAVAAQLPPLALAGALAAALSGLGTWLVARRVRRQTHGLDAAQLQSMYDYYDAVLHAVREGLLLVDGDGRVRLVNDECRRLLDLPEDVVGRPVSELGLVPPLERTLVDGTPRQDELHVTSARVLVLNQARAQWHGRDLGTVVTLRDRTDLQALTGELDTARGLTEALRSQAHESANRLHTVVSLIELDRAQEALAFATEELSLAQRLTDEVVGAVDEPALAALLLGKSAQASERGIDFVVGDHVVVPDGVAPPRDLVTIVGNLVDNAFDALATVEGERVVRFDAWARDGYVVLTVADTGPGVPGPDPMQAFRRGWSTKAAAEGATGGRGLGLALVVQSVERLGGSIEVDGPPGARFTVRLPIPGEQP